VTLRAQRYAHTAYTHASHTCIFAELIRVYSITDDPPTRWRTACVCS